jgi:GTP-binding protein
VGIADLGSGDSLCIADLPGLIEGAAEGQGLGHRFLKHVERCRVLLHLVDVSESAETDPAQAFEVISTELIEFSPELAAKPRILVATKCEGSPGEEERIAALEARAGLAAVRISSLRHEGLVPLLGAARKCVQEA